MSVRQQLRDSGLFDENVGTESNDTVHCYRLFRCNRLWRKKGDRVDGYLPSSDIFRKCSEKGKFPNPDRLYEFFTRQQWAHSIIETNSNEAFMNRDSQHVAEVVEIIRGGQE